MNRGTGFYPWTTDWHTVVAIFVGGLIFVLGLYAAMRQGRLERSDPDDKTGGPVHRYAGIIESGSRKPTVFVYVLIVVVVAWVVGYVVNVAMNGLGY